MDGPASGYDCEFVADNLPQVPQTKCPTCKLVLREPYQVSCCGRIFCLTCIKGIKEGNRPCPWCDKNDFTMFEDKSLKRLLLSCQVHCSNSQQGCQWEGELGQLDKHITNDCPLTIIDCDFQHVGCKVRLPRKDMPAHLGESVVNHLSLQATSFKQTVDRLDKEKKEMHENVFTLQESNEQARQEIVELREKNTQLEQQVSQLNLVINQCIACIPICPCEFTIDNFRQRRQAKENWMSPPLHSHARGYKMCLEVCTNYWIVFSRSTYVAVFIYLMKGDFDDELSWPFSGKFHVTLVSQDTSTDHMHTIDFTDNNARYAKLRVTNGERSGYRYGKYDFISHERLVPSYNTNDSLTFRIVTDGT